MFSKGQYSVNKVPSPYKISFNPAYNRDNSSERHRQFLMLRGEQEARNTQKKQLIGNLDSLSQDFTSLFTVISTIRQKLNDTKHLTPVNKYHFLIIKKLISYLDKINSIIVNKIIPIIDNLGK